MPRRTAAEAERTRADLLHVARRAFGRDGFSATALDDIADGAGVTRGALHHHFGDKRALFVEVFDGLVDDIDRQIRAAVDRAEGMAKLRAGSEALFDAVADPEVRQIWLADAPAVLGLDEWYRRDRARGMRTLGEGMRSLADVGLLEPALVAPVTALLYGAMTEASIALSSGGGELGREELIDGIERMVLGLLRTRGG